MAENYIPPPIPLEVQIRMNGQTRVLMERIALDVATGAQAIAASEAFETGEYEGSIGGRADATSAGYVGIVEALAPYSVYLEVGTEDTEAHHTLTRAAEESGLRMTEEAE